MGVPRGSMGNKIWVPEGPNSFEILGAGVLSHFKCRGHERNRPSELVFLGSKTPKNVGVGVYEVHMQKSGEGGV